MPAAAVIPAPRAYINVVAVKKPVVGFESKACGRYLRFEPSVVPVVGAVGLRVGWFGGRRCVWGDEGFMAITYGLWSETCGIVHWSRQTH